MCNKIEASIKIRKAVIAVAGLGTRFLLATKAIPKEMLTIVDRPTTQYIVGDDMILSETPCAKQFLNLFDAGDKIGYGFRHPPLGEQLTKHLKEVVATL